MLRGDACVCAMCHRVNGWIIDGGGTMEYKGFNIIKKKPGLYWVIYNGSMIGSAVSVEVAKEYIDELTTCHV